MKQRDMEQEKTKKDKRKDANKRPERNEKNKTSAVYFVAET